MRIKILYFTDKGKALAQRLKESLSEHDAVVVPRGVPLAYACGDAFADNEALVFIGAFLLTFEGKFDIISNITASLTCVSNVGPGFGAVGPTENFAGFGTWGKTVSSMLMLFGRLELLPMFILFTRSAWHKY